MPLRREFRGSFVLADFPAEAERAAAYNILNDFFGNSPFSIREASEALQSEGFDINILVSMRERGEIRRV